MANIDSQTKQIAASYTVHGVEVETTYLAATWKVTAKAITDSNATQAACRALSTRPKTLSRIGGNNVAAPSLTKLPEGRDVTTIEIKR